MLRPRAIYAALRSARDMSVAAGARMRARTEVGALVQHELTTASGTPHGLGKAPSPHSR